MSFSINTSISAIKVDCTLTNTVNTYGWSYQIDGGSWHNFYAASTTSKKKVTGTISGLSPLHTYTIRFRARLTPSGQTASYDYESITLTTQRAYTLYKVNPVEIDVTNPSATFQVFSSESVPSGCKHSLLVYLTSSDYMGLGSVNASGASTTTNHTVNFSSVQRTHALNVMTAQKERTVTFELRTFDSNNNLIETPSTYSGKLFTTAENSSPVFDSGILYFENTEAVYNLINNQDTPRYLLQNESQLRVMFDEATAKNGASIVSTKVTIGSAVGTGTWTADVPPWNYSTVITNPIQETGELPIIATVIDSRGYTASITIDGEDIITVLPYKSVTFDEYYIKRVNGVEDTISAVINGSWQSIAIDGVEYNELAQLKFRYKQMPSGSWSSWFDVMEMTGFSTSTGGFEFEGELVTLSGDYAYQLNFIAADRLYDADALPVVSIPKATPLMSFREGAVGVLTNNPTFPLDVNGLIGQNGQNIFGFVRQLTATDNLNDVDVTGLYTVVSGAPSSNLNYPTTYQGYLQVIKFQSTLAFQIYYVRTSSSTLTPAIYIRTFYNSFGSYSSWRQINLT